ncbi:hypothetical protein PCE1_001185 [Barthelona sp. PCE]
MAFFKKGLAALSDALKIEEDEESETRISTPTRNSNSHKFPLTPTKPKDSPSVPVVSTATPRRTPKNTPLKSSSTDLERENERLNHLLTDALQKHDKALIEQEKLIRQQEIQKEKSDTEIKRLQKDIVRLRLTSGSNEGKKYRAAAELQKIEIAGLKSQLEKTKSSLQLMEMQNTQLTKKLASTPNEAPMSEIDMEIIKKNEHLKARIVDLEESAIEKTVEVEVEKIVEVPVEVEKIIEVEKVVEVEKIIEVESGSTIDALRAEIKQLKDNSVDLTNELDTLKEQAMTEANNNEKELMCTIEEMKVEIKQNKSEMMELDGRCSELDIMVTELTQQKAEMEMRVTDQEATIVEREHAIDVNESEISGYREQISELEANMADTTTSLEELRTKLAAKEDEMMHVNAESDGFKNKSDEFITRIGELEKLLETSRENVESLKKQLEERNKEFEEVTEELKEKENKILVIEKDFVERSEKFIEQTEEMGKIVAELTQQKNLADEEKEDALVGVKIAESKQKKVSAKYNETVKELQELKIAELSFKKTIETQQFDIEDQINYIKKLMSENKKHLGALRKNSASLTELQTAKVALDNEVDGLNAELAAKKTVVGDLELTIAGLKDRLNTYKKRLDQMTELNTEVQSLKSCITEKDTEIANLNVKLTNQSEKDSEREKLAVDRELELVKNMRVLSGLRSSIVNLESTIEAQNKELDMKKNEIEELKRVSTEKSESCEYAPLFKAVHESLMQWYMRCSIDVEAAATSATSETRSLLETLGFDHQEVEINNDLSVPILYVDRAACAEFFVDYLTVPESRSVMLPVIASYLGLTKQQSRLIGLGQKRRLRDRVKGFFKGANTLGNAWNTAIETSLEEEMHPLTPAVVKHVAQPKDEDVKPLDLEHEVSEKVEVEEDSEKCE